MALRSGAANGPSSPSFDTEAASQQLIAEASSPVLRHTAAPVTTSDAAQRGANLLNAARALPKPSAPAEGGGKLAKIQLKTPNSHVTTSDTQLKSSKLQGAGKLPRASLAGLVSAGLQSKARGKQMYDIEPSPQKKRRSLPAQIAAIDDEDAVVPETSQVHPDEDRLFEIPESLDVSAPEAAFGDDDIIDAPTPPAASPEEVVESVAKKGRGRPGKNRNSVTHVAAAEEIAEVAPTTILPKQTASLVPKKRRGRPRKSGESVTPDASEFDTSKAQPEAPIESSAKNGRGQPRESGESTESHPLQADFAELDEDFRKDVLRGMQGQLQRSEVPVKPKRKARPERDVDTNIDARTKPVKKVKKLKGPKMVSLDEPEFDVDLLAPFATPRQNVRRGTPKDARQESREIRRQERRENAQVRNELHAGVEMPYRPTHVRATRTQAGPTSEPEDSTAAAPTAAIERKGEAAQRIARNTRAAMASSGSKQTKRRQMSRKIQISFHDPALATEVDGENEEEDAEAEPVPDDDSRIHGDRVDTVNDPGSGTNEQEDDHEVADERGDDDTSTKGALTSGLDAVFRFADGEARPGVCSVGLAREIHRKCDSVHVTLSRERCSIDDITTCKDDLVQYLTSIHTNIQEDTRFDFKQDAFTYLFQALALVLEAMYDKFENDGHKVNDSLQAMQILHPFIREILSFKDTMDSWKVKVQGRHKGDRPIKGVESNLIAPLRVVEKDFRARLGVLRKAEQDRQARNEIERQHEKQEQEMVLQEEALRSARERRKRWQDLHIARMQHESDPYRRRRLRFVEPHLVSETDANGNPFERVPVFGERSAPPPCLVASTSGREWTQEQETVLLDALQSSTSLERIFRSHCGPGGVLRDFSVTDFAAKLAWVRSAWAHLSHQHGWELPEWVKEIPILP